MRALCYLTLAVLTGIPAQAASRVVTVSVDSIVHPITTEILVSTFQYAATQDAELVLIRLNTPGGLLEATREIVEKIVAAPIPVVTYVTPSGGRAASAGFFILQAADIAAMAPGTNTGAASPVIAGGGEMEGTMKKKVESDAAAALRSVVAKRGRNAELAEKTVLEAQSFTDQEALDNRLIEIVARDETDLLAQLKGREITRFDGSKVTLELDAPVLLDYPLSTKQRLIKSIANPNAALALLVLGALGIYIEFSSPGLIVPGVAGALMALLGLTAIAVFPINWLGVALMILAIVMFVLEANITSGGILGVGGAVAMTLGALILIDSPLPELQIRLSVALALAVPFSLITIFLLSLVLKARKNKVVTGSEGIVGETGIARTSLSPRGKVFVHGEYWDAVSTTPVEAGSEVRVIAIRGLSLEVEPVSKQQGG